MLKDADKYTIIAIRSDQCRNKYDYPCDVYNPEEPTFYFKCMPDGTCREIEGQPQEGELVCDPSDPDYCHHYECRESANGYKECVEVIDVSPPHVARNSWDCDPDNYNYEDCNPIIKTHYECTQVGECVEVEGDGPDECNPADPNSCFEHLECIEDPTTGQNICVRRPGKMPIDAIPCLNENGSCGDPEPRLVRLCIGNPNGTDCRCQYFETTDPYLEHQCTTDEQCCEPPLRNRCDFQDNGEAICREVEEFGSDLCKENNDCVKYHKACITNSVDGLKYCIEVEGDAPDECGDDLDCRNIGRWMCDGDGNCFFNENALPGIDSCFPGIKECPQQKPYQICVNFGGEYQCVTVYRTVPPLDTCIGDAGCEPIPRTYSVCVYKDNIYQCENQILTEPPPLLCHEDPNCSPPPDAICSLEANCDKDYGNANLHWSISFKNIGFKKANIYYKTENDANYTFFRETTSTRGDLKFTELNCCQNIIFKMICWDILGLIRTNCTVETQPVRINPIILLRHNCPNFLVNINNLDASEILGYTLYVKKCLMAPLMLLGSLCMLLHQQMTKDYLINKLGIQYMLQKF